MEQKFNTQDGQKAYTPLLLKIYNFLILKIANTYAWKCPTEIQLKFFNQNISNIHLDVGVGSGYYMDNCTFPNSEYNKLALMDLNQNCLNYCAQKLQRYQPQLFQQDIFQPIINIDDRFNSISLNYVLHCLPGELKDKEIAITHLKKLLTPTGSIFGSTILGNGVTPNWLANKFLKLYNKKKIFCNYNDEITTLNLILTKNFEKVEIKQIGMVALFKASQPIN